MKLIFKVGTLRPNELNIEVIPQKSNLPTNFFEIFPESSLLSTASKKTEMIGHHSRLRDMMGQS